MNVDPYLTDGWRLGHLDSRHGLIDVDLPLEEAYTQGVLLMIHNGVMGFALETLWPIIQPADRRFPNRPHPHITGIGLPSRLPDSIAETMIGQTFGSIIDLENVPPWAMTLMDDRIVRFGRSDNATLITGELADTLLNQEVWRTKARIKGLPGQNNHPRVTNPPANSHAKPSPMSALCLHSLRKWCAVLAPFLRLSKTIGGYDLHKIAP